MRTRFAGKVRKLILPKKGTLIGVNRDRGEEDLTAKIPKERKERNANES
jgi:hypothetical protein